jgi:hypothetical protein
MLRRGSRRARSGLDRPARALPPRREDAQALAARLAVVRADQHGVARTDPSEIVAGRRFAGDVDVVQRPLEHARAAAVAKARGVDGTAIVPRRQKAQFPPHRAHPDAGMSAVAAVRGSERSATDNSLKTRRLIAMAFPRANCAWCLSRNPDLYRRRLKKPSRISPADSGCDHCTSRIAWPERLRCS